MVSPVFRRPADTTSRLCVVIRCRCLFDRFKGDNRSVNQITDDFDRVYQVDVSDNTLTFNRFIGSNAGRYTCKLFDDDDAFVDAKVIYVAR